MTTVQKNIEHLTETFLTDGLSAQEQSELQHLLKISENKDYFKKMYVLWYTANRTSGKEHVEQALHKTLFRLLKQQPRKREEVGWFFSFRKLAAAVLISFVLGSVFYYVVDSRTKNTTSPVASFETSKVTVPLGSLSQVELPDGTLVSLNAGSKLHYHSSFGHETRKVWLEGEGYFKVTKNASIPFIVMAKDVTIKALGTEFNVKAYPEEKTVQTTLVNGLVTVRQANTSADTKEMTLKPKQTVTIYEHNATETAAQEDMTQPVTGGTSNRITEDEGNETIVGSMVTENTVLKDNIKTELYTSWKDPRWVIESEPLSDLALKLQRRYDVQIIIADDALKQYPINGTLTDETLEQLLEIMKSITPINYTIRKKTVTLTINPQKRKIFDELMKNNNNISS